MFGAQGYGYQIMNIAMDIGTHLVHQNSSRACLAFSDICPPGFTGEEDSPGCIMCPDNTHKALPGRQACNACPEGHETEGNEGGDSIEDCLGMLDLLCFLTLKPL